jgi:hypothetical protein
MTDENEIVAAASEDKFVDLKDIQILTDLQKDFQLVSTQKELIENKLELVKLQLRIKYNLSEESKIDQKTGKIS